MHVLFTRINKQNKEVNKMKKLPKYIVTKSLTSVGNMRFNGYSVECDLLDNGKIKMNMTKFTRYVPRSTKIVDYDYFQKRFRDESKTDYELLMDALAFCEPEYKYEE